MSTASERQIGGSHYKAGFQHWDYVHWTQLPYLPAQASKYLTRWKKKNGLQDLEKALHFMDKFIEEQKDRHEGHIRFTKNFISANNVGKEEAACVRLIAQYHMGELQLLDMARSCIVRIIEARKKEVEALGENKEDEPRTDWRND